MSDKTNYSGLLGPAIEKYEGEQFGATTTVNPLLKSKMAKSTATTTTTSKLAISPFLKSRMKTVMGKMAMRAQSPNYINSKTLLLGSTAVASVVLSMKTDKKINKVVGMAVGLVVSGLVINEWSKTSNRNKFMEKAATENAIRKAEADARKAVAVSAITRASQTWMSARTIMTNVRRVADDLAIRSKSNMPAMDISDASLRMAANAVARKDWNNIDPNLKIKWVEKSSYNFPEWIDPSKITTDPTNSLAISTYETLTNLAASGRIDHSVAFAGCTTHSDTAKGVMTGCDAAIITKRGHRAFLTALPAYWEDIPLAIYVEGKVEKGSGSRDGYTLLFKKRGGRNDVPGVGTDQRAVGGNLTSPVKSINGYDVFKLADIDDPKYQPTGGTSSLVKRYSPFGNALFIGSCKEQGIEVRMNPEVEPWMYVDSAPLQQRYIQKVYNKGGGAQDYYRFWTMLTSSYNEPTDQEQAFFWEPIIANLSINHKLMMMDTNTFAAWSVPITQTRIIDTRETAAVCRIMGIVLQVFGAVLSCFPVTSIAGAAMITVGTIIQVIGTFVENGRANPGTLIASIGGLMQTFSGQITSVDSQFGNLIDSKLEGLRQKFNTIGVNIMSPLGDVIPSMKDLLRRTGGDVENGIGNIVDLLVNNNLVSGSQISKIKSWNLPDLNSSLNSYASGALDSYKSTYHIYAVKTKQQVSAFMSLLNKYGTMGSGGTVGGFGQVYGGRYWDSIEEVILFCDAIEKTPYSDRRFYLPAG